MDPLSQAILSKGAAAPSVQYYFTSRLGIEEEGAYYDEYPADIKIDGSGNVYALISYVQLGGSQVPVLIKYASNSTIEWTRALTAIGTGHALALDNDENIWVCCAGSGKVHLVKYSSTGTLLLIRQYAPSFGTYNLLYPHIARNSAGNIVLVASQTNGATHHLNVAVIGTDGTLGTQAGFATTVSSTENKVAADPGGNLFVSTANRVLLLNSSLVLQWARIVAGTVYGSSSDNVGGLYCGSATNLFLLSGSGTYTWINNVSGGSLNDVFFDGASHLYFIGRNGGSALNYGKVSAALPSSITWQRVLGGNCVSVYHKVRAASGAIYINWPVVFDPGGIESHDWQMAKLPDDGTTPFALSGPLGGVSAGGFSFPSSSGSPTSFTPGGGVASLLSTTPATPTYSGAAITPSTTVVSI